MVVENLPARTILETQKDFLVWENPFVLGETPKYIGASYYFIYSATWSTGTIASLKM